ncbi:hypothetical protein [Chitinivibrio alkaliphilus]|uniref:Chemotaxis phosphatase CheX-like domain-containing protein n=1 Tax=Chitinivibrio alkaliphilus ACht1 TaxID=1313304 RepID=U7DB53_9BACT|nr:hypothetical protein [Chitinivibrio alkaliphilus]ERP31645.1 hypothetical protein CALK_1509 [Chitinivibrio alkaliphilus ACht1]
MADMAVVLKEIHDEICSAAVHTVESLLNVDVSVGEDWEVRERLTGKYDHIITLGCSNSDYQGVIMVAVDDAGAREYGESHEEIVDIFGEIANTYCGMLMDQKGVKEKIGILSQAIPMYAAKQTFFPRAAAASGSVITEDGVAIHIGFAIRGFMTLLNM